MIAQPGNTAATANCPFQPVDLLSLDIITDARLSPDGRRLAYVVKRAHRDRNEYTSAIFLMEVGDTGDVALPRGSRRLTAGACRDAAPCWSPDGRRLAFVSDRSGIAQLYVLALTDGEARPITQLGRGATGPMWSPDGRRLAFVSQEREGTGAAPQPTGAPIRRITRLRYRFNEIGYIDDRFQHLWVVDADGGEPRQITRGDQDDLMPCWSPDGRWLAFVANEEAHSFSQLYVVPAEPGAGVDTGAGGRPDGARRISRGTEMALLPAWSPDGSRVAYIGRRAGAPSGANNTIYTVAASGGQESTDLLGTFDPCPGVGLFSDTWNAPVGGPLWAPDSASIYFTACDRGRTVLFRTDPSGRPGPLIDGERTLALVSLSAAGDRFAYAAGNCATPCDLYTCAADGADERRLTCLNGEFLGERAMGRLEPIPFPSFDGGFQVDAWLLRPVGYEEGRRYPLVQVIHGGPHAAFGHTFFFDMQLWAGRGWNVLFINPRGSQGYGEAFSVCNLGDWGGGDGREQELALDLAIGRGGVDPERLAVAGVSYGGFMTNWLIGHSARYRVAVSENSITNLVSFYTTSDIGWHWLEREMRADVWGNLAWYMDRSPISHVPRIDTPTLVIQAENDWRCPSEQGEQLYTALRVRGVPCEMVRFPGEGHSFLSNGKPESRLQRREHTLRWLASYLERDTAPQDGGIDDR